MKKKTIREMLAVMGIAVALTACGQSNASQSEPVSEETLQEDEADSMASGEDAGDETSSDDTNAVATSDVLDSDVVDEPAGDDAAGDETALLDDGFYITVDNEDATQDPDFDKMAILHKAEIKDGVLKITASFEQQNDSFDKIAYYTYETREIPVAKDLVICYSGEETSEEISADVFNLLYADPHASDRDDHRGLGIEIEIKEGEVKTITICA